MVCSGKYVLNCSTATVSCSVSCARAGIMLSELLVRRGARQLSEHMCVEDAQDLSDHGLECVREVLYKYRHMVPSRKRGTVADGIRFFTGLRLALHQTQDSDGSTFPVLLSRDEALQPPGHDVPHFRRVALGG